MNQQEKQEIVKYRIIKARETFNEVKLHIENKLWTTAINRLYYACYYAVIALLMTRIFGRIPTKVSDNCLAYIL